MTKKKASPKIVSIEAGELAKIKADLAVYAEIADEQAQRAELIAKQRDELLAANENFRQQLNRDGTFCVEFGFGARVFTPPSPLDNVGVWQPGIVTGVFLTPAGATYRIQRSAESDGVMFQSDVVVERPQNPAFACPGEDTIIKSLTVPLEEVRP